MAFGAGVMRRKERAGHIDVSVTSRGKLALDSGSLDDTLTSAPATGLHRGLCFGAVCDDFLYHGALEGEAASRSDGAMTPDVRRHVGGGLRCGIRRWVVLTSRSAGPAVLVTVARLRPGGRWGFGNGVV